MIPYSKLSVSDLTRVGSYDDDRVWDGISRTFHVYMPGGALARRPRSVCGRGPGLRSSASRCGRCHNDSQQSPY
jgi:hypothetical protein